MELLVNEELDKERIPDDGELEANQRAQATILMVDGIQLFLADVLITPQNQALT